MNGFSVLLILKLLAICQSAPSGEQNDTLDCTIPSNNGRSFPNLKNCSSYYQCENQTEILMNCSIGQHFNARLKVCDDPQFANCKLNGTLSPILLPIETQNSTDSSNTTSISKNDVTGSNTTSTRSKSINLNTIHTTKSKEPHVHVIKDFPKSTDLNSTSNATNSKINNTQTTGAPVKEGQNKINNIFGLRHDNNGTSSSNSTIQTVNVSNGKDIKVDTNNSTNSSTETSDSNESNDKESDSDGNASNDN